MHERARGQVVHAHVRARGDEDSIATRRSVGGGPCLLHDRILYGHSQSGRGRDSVIRKERGTRGHGVLGQHRVRPFVDVMRRRVAPVLKELRSAAGVIGLVVVHLSRLAEPVHASREQDDEESHDDPAVQPVEPAARLGVRRLCVRRLGLSRRFVLDCGGRMSLGLSGEDPEDSHSHHDQADRRDPEAGPLEGRPRRQTLPGEIHDPGQIGGNGHREQSQIARRPVDPERLLGRVSDRRQEDAAGRGDEDRKAANVGDARGAASRQLSRAAADPPPRQEHGHDRQRGTAGYQPPRLRCARRTNPHGQHVGPPSGIDPCADPAPSTRVSAPLRWRAAPARM